MFHKTMLHRVEVGVVRVSRKVSIIADRVLPVLPLPNDPLAYRALPDARRSQSDINAKRAILLIQTERRDT
jgi:hypothetical protein